ncbi:MAG: gluconate 2-dehydrogenase subunit 3 family protein [Prolixibacteraceae bacterium]
MRDTLSRRHFIQMAAIGSGSLLLLPGCTNLSSKSSWRFFTEKEALLVGFIVEQIIPTDEWPGARDAGVVNYIDKQLVGPLSRFQEKYRKGIFAMVTSCEELYKKQFGELSWDEQTDFLKKMESGKLAELLKDNLAGQGMQKTDHWADGLDRTLFDLIRSHTMQGFYGSPRHGGNKNYVSYRMIGLDYPFTIGQNRYKG